MRKLTKTINNTQVFILIIMLTVFQLCKNMLNKIGLHTRGVVKRIWFHEADCRTYLGHGYLYYDSPIYSYYNNNCTLCVMYIRWQTHTSHTYRVPILLLYYKYVYATVEWSCLQIVRWYVSDIRRTVRPVGNFVNIDTVWCCLIIAVGN